MPNFTGQLNTNIVIGALYNQIISIKTFSENIGEMFSKLVDKARVDGSMYGDTKVYNSIDIPGTKPWGADAEATNLLKTHRPKKVKCQSISIDQFRQVAITIDNYLTKQAFLNEGSFAEFNGAVLSTMRDAKKIYDTTIWNTYVGTAKSSVQETHNIAVQASDVPSLAQGAGSALAKLLFRIKDNSRDYNDYGFMRAVDPENVEVIWNADYVVDFKKYDIPAIFHEKEVIDKFGYDNALPARFFGTVVTTAGTVSSSNKVRTLVERSLNASGKDVEQDADDALEYFPGDLLPIGATYKANEAYKEDANIIAIVTTPDSVPFMSGFEVGTNFFNPVSLTENNYITWGHNTLERLYDKPWVKITKAS